MINLQGSRCSILAFRLNEGLQSDLRVIFMTGLNSDVLFFYTPSIKSY